MENELEKVLESVKISLRAVVPFLISDETVKVTERIVVFLNEQNKKARVQETEANSRVSSKNLIYTNSYK